MPLRQAMRPSVNSAGKLYFPWLDTIHECARALAWMVAVLVLLAMLLLVMTADHAVRRASGDLGRGIKVVTNQTANIGAGRGGIRRSADAVTTQAVISLTAIRWTKPLPSVVAPRLRLGYASSRVVAPNP